MAMLTAHLKPGSGSVVAAQHNARVSVGVWAGQAMERHGSTRPGQSHLSAFSCERQSGWV